MMHKKAYIFNAYTKNSYTPQNVVKEVNAYYKRVSIAGILVPKHFQCYVKNREVLIFQSNIVGEKVSDLLETTPDNKLINQALTSVVELFKLSWHEGVFLDLKLSNLITTDGGKIAYIDFFPSLTIENINAIRNTNNHNILIDSVCHSLTQLGGLAVYWFKHLLKNSYIDESSLKQCIRSTLTLIENMCGIALLSSMSNIRIQSYVERLRLMQKFVAHKYSLPEFKIRFLQESYYSG
ncbi:hypothetical protein VHA01S_031_00020 [Vibrio halioticoli NBRC 102217]|uniref:Protein kinase domain-containing protein n=1 Tax=Vibrio halioticoli NBRC 102217 TaxID=1219072 RepID=V5F446_9VIBR|nr:hypothetical protein [Vibrio halioticoli]GAD89989.1 hypothetical protein VHA01S_031_00020 [Vibrio halioticoli NBRC 102217]